MLPTSLVIDFCGPHRFQRRWSPLYHRIDHACDVARRDGFPLLVVGDSRLRRDVSHLVRRARGQGLPTLWAYDPGGRTLTDARAALRALRDRPELAEVRELLVVTDHWHFPRCHTYLDRERGAFLPGRPLAIVDASTDAGPPVPSEVLEGELRGITDYLAKRPYRPYGRPYGKPTHPSRTQETACAR